MEYPRVNCTSWGQGIRLTDNMTYTADYLDQLINHRNLAGVIFVIILIVIGVVGNILVILVFAFKFGNSTYRIYVLCLAFLDTVNCCVTMPFVVTYLLFSQNYPSAALCKFGHFAGFFIGLASPFTLILIAADRYRNICQPLCLQITEKKAKYSCAVVIAASFAMSWHVPVIYGTTEHVIEDVNITVIWCFKEDDFLSQKVTWWQYTILTIILVIVSSCLGIAYFIIMMRVRHKSKYFSSLTSNNNCNKVAFVTKQIQTRKTTLTFFIITTVYVISSIIHHILAIILHVVPNLECYMTFTEGAVYWTFFWTIFINNVANPFIYGLSDDRFRRHLQNCFNKPKTTPVIMTTGQPRRHAPLNRK